MPASLTGEPPLRSAGRAHVRNLFLRLLGLIFLIAFLSLLSQITLLIGHDGLLPAREFLRRAAPGILWTPTLFWIDASDTALRAACVSGALLSLGLALNFAPRYCLIALWALYLSLATVGQNFLSFQWDNLLLEAAFFGVFVAPGGLRPKNPPPPHPVGIFLILWLVFRLHVESGLSKILTGDPTWRNLTAMATYYETAPLPTWVGWYAHQMPMWAHRLCSLFTFVVEIALPPLIWSSHRIRGFVVAVMIAMQVSIVLTGNYGFFNYLSIATCLFVLDDGHLEWIAARFGRGLAAAPPRLRSAWRTVLLTAIAAVLVPLSLVPFLPFFRPPAGISRPLAPVRRAMNTFRSINAYHLFAQMTRVRKEVVIEGSNDQNTWLPYEFRYKPGDPDVAPPFVAPHQPRIDFQLWFLLLGGPPRERYFYTLVTRLLAEPKVVAALFARDPFPDRPPAYLRIAAYRYQFTDRATRRDTGAWWTRTLLGYSDSMSREKMK